MSNAINWRFSEDDIAQVKEMLKSNFSTSKGTNMYKKLEEIFAEKVGAKHGITFNSGTTTLHGCVAAADVGRGDEVIVPAPNVLHTAAILYHNAVSVFADSQEDTSNIDPSNIEERITDRTKAIIPVSWYDLPVDFGEIMKIAKEYNLIVIADNTKTHRAIYKGKKIGGITSW